MENTESGIESENQNMRKKSVLSQQEADEDRLLQLLTTVLSLKFGTLWWIDEQIWKQKLLHYDEASTRKCHPGLYLGLSSKMDSLYEPIPFVHGRSAVKNKRTELPVRELTIMEPERVTWFRLGRQIRVVLMDFAKREGREFDAMLIRLNHHKPSLSEREEENLLHILDTSSYLRRRAGNGK